MVSGNMKVSLRSIIALLLAFIMLTGLWTTSAQSAMTVTRYNSLEHNEEILHILRRIYKDDYVAQAALQEMYRLGLVDGDGEFVTSTIDVDGDNLTINEIWELLSSENVDLEKLVMVEGMPVTLGNLKTMIEIEFELQKIKDKYFNDNVTLTEAHKFALESLQDQIENEGIMMYRALPPSTGHPSGADHHIYAEVDISTTTYNNGSGAKSLTVTLKNQYGGTLSQVPGRDIKIPYRFVDCSGVRDINYRGADGVLIFTANTTVTSQTINFEILNDSSHFEGKKAFLIQFYDLENIMFKNEVWAAEKLIVINSSYVWGSLSASFYGGPIEGTVRYIEDTYVYAPRTSGFYGFDDRILSIMEQDNIYTEVRLELKNTSGYTLSNCYPIITFGDDGGYLVLKRSPDDPYPDVPNVSFGISNFANNQTYVGTTGFIPEYAKYMKRSSYSAYKGGFIYLTFSSDMVDKYVSVQRFISFVDTEPPRVDMVYIPDGMNFEYGHSVPITVRFTEPVNLSNMKFTLNGRELSPIEAGSKGTRYATFLYKINPIDKHYISIGSMTGVKDLSGFSQPTYNGGSSWNNVIDMVKYFAFDTPSASVTVDEEGKLIGSVSLGIMDTEGDEVAFTHWLEEEALENRNDNFKVPSIYASIDGGKTKIDLYVDNAENPTKLVGTFLPEINDRVSDVVRTVEFYFDPVIGRTENYKLFFGKYAEYTVPPSVFLEDGDFYITDNFPSDRVFFAEEDFAPKLDYTVTKLDATWRQPKDFEWTSSNEAVAAIDQNGVISLTGKAGSAALTLTAKNGGIAGREVTMTTEPITVKVGLIPFLKIPSSASGIFIRQGDSAEVRWTSNLITKNAEINKDTDFVIKMFLCDYSSGSLSKGSKVYSEVISASTSNPIASHSIPAEYLQTISTIGRYSYIVEVSSINPYKADQTLTATAYITIKSRPAVVRLSKLDNYFISDSTTNLPISWTLENYDTLNNAEFEFEIRDNSTNATIGSIKATDNAGGTYQFKIPKVDNGLKKTITVTAKAKNSVDSTWSYDSFVLHVYNNEALKIWIDGTAVGDKHIMSNIDMISSMTSEEILALKRNIYLKNAITINYDDYAWGRISDQISWKSSDNSIATINFDQASLYDNIESYTYKSYRPDTEFLLSGLKDGTTNIAATHVATSIAKILDVEVKTLKDKLYIFQIFPKAKTTLTYINGKGEARTAETSSNGELALYEESEIKSQIYMKSVKDGKEYMGTQYGNLLSSEQDYTRLKLYPVNNFQLREIATVELYFKKPDGKPYEGDVILRGGVYKNDKYCSEALLYEKDGKQDQIIKVGSDGRFTVKMDSSQFWTDSNTEGLNPGDKLEFIFEVRFPEDKYFPQLLYANGNVDEKQVIRFGERNIKLKEVKEGQRYKPFVATQTIDYELSNGKTIDVLDFNGRIGPNQTSKSPTLITTVLWWGEDIESGFNKHKLTFDDEYGIIPKGQSNKNIVYPFSTIKGTRSYFLLNRETMKDWIGSKNSRGINLIVSDSEGNQYMKKTMPFRIINMLDIEKLDTSNSLTFLLKTMGSNYGADASKLNLSDGIVGDGFDFLSQIGTGLNNGDKLFSMAVSPTLDPTVYVALIQVSTGNMEGNVTGIYSDNQLGSDFDSSPSAFDMLDMMKGKYKENQKKKLDKNPQEGRSKANRNIHFTIGGYMEAEISYNFEKEKWEIFILNGGFNAGGGVSYSWNYNAFCGPVPVTGQFQVGGTAEVIFKAAVQRGKEIEDKYNESSVNDYLTTLRLYTYIKAFGGLGFDYSVLALKIGVFGQISCDAQFAFLNRPYISNKAIDGRKLDVVGKTGVEFVAKALFVSYEKILASKKFDLYSAAYGDWNKLHRYWDEVKKGSSGNPGNLLSMPMVMGDNSIMYPVSDRAVIEKRDYLDQFERTWAPSGDFRLFSLDPVSKVKDLETNSYPYSNPVLSDDGQIMAYISDADSTDIEKTEVRWTRIKGGSYPDGTPINEAIKGYGDSQLKLSGSEDFYAAVWVQQSEEIKKEPGDLVTNADIALMLNSTEIMASIYNKDRWDTIRLTNNASPDMAPVVATNGDRVFVAWRSVYASDSSRPMDFDSDDSILYRIYNKGVWSEPQTLYNGTSGAVKGLEAAMLKDGTAAVTYVIDTTGFEKRNTIAGRLNGINSGLETVYAIVDAHGTVQRNVRLTNDDYIDENPQITTVMFDGDIERFVLGWYSLHDSDGIIMNDIRLCAFDSVGALYDTFVDSVNNINAYSRVNISPNFRFSRNADYIDDLSILWNERISSYSSETDLFDADRDVLKGIKFMSNGGRVYITAPLDIAEMGEYTFIDHFDAYNAGDNTIKAVILGSSYNNGYKETKVESGEGEEIIVTPIAKAGLYTATGTYQNKIEIVSVVTDYDSVIRGMEIPVQFNIFNSGVEPINKIEITIGDNYIEYNDLMLLPNDSITLNAYYDIPGDRVVNPTYTVKSYFGQVADIDSVDGFRILSELSDSCISTATLYLDIPDVGISKLETISEEEGKRVMQITLYNKSDIPIAGSNRRARIGFYIDSEFTLPIKEITGQEDGGIFTVEDSDSYLIDAGAYTKQFTFDIASYIGAGKEIPAEGIRIYARAWIEEPVDTVGDSKEFDTIIEYYQANNVASIFFESLLNRNDNKAATISSVLMNNNSVSMAEVTVKNNSLVNVSSGNLIVSLLDQNGRIIETQQSYNDESENRGLISLGGEETTKRLFTFNNKGTSLVISYSNAILEQGNNNSLVALSMTGIPLKLDRDITEYQVNTKNLLNTIVSAVAEDPRAKISINGVETELGSLWMNLKYGENTVNIVVTAADGVTQKEYKVTINNVSTSHSPGGSGGTNDFQDITNVLVEDGIIVSGDSIIYRTSVVAQNGEVVISLSDSDISKLIMGALKNNSTSIVIAPVIKGAVNKVTLSLSRSSLLEVASKTKASIRVETPLFCVTAYNSALADIGKDKGSRINITLQRKDNTYEVLIMSDGKPISNSIKGIIATIRVENATNGTVAALIGDDGTYQIVKTSVVKGEVMLVPLKGCGRIKIMDNAKHFVDIERHWAKEYIDFASARDLFNGTGDSTFSPYMTMTRGMFVTILGRLSSIDRTSFITSSFKDVDNTAWYGPYVEWAAQCGIVKGTGNQQFDPNKPITREQLAAVLNRYIEHEGLGLIESADNSQVFSDYDKISEYARNSASLMQRLGIMLGKDNNSFDPQGIATRAEVSAILQRLITSIIR